MNNIQILIAFATSDGQSEIAAEVPSGTTLHESLLLLVDQLTALPDGGRGVATGVWGKIRPPNYVLREGDRIEMYRPLKADPKQARRARAGVKANRS